LGDRLWETAKNLKKVTRKETVAKRRTGGIIQAGKRENCVKEKGSYMVGEGSMIWRDKKILF